MELRNSPQAGRTAPRKISGFLYPKSGCYGREARSIQDLFTGKDRGSLVAVSNLPATFFTEG